MIAMAGLAEAAFYEGMPIMLAGEISHIIHSVLSNAA